LEHLPAPAVKLVRAALVICTAFVLGACDHGAGLLVKNETSSTVLIRVPQTNTGPLVFTAPAETLGWALHPIDLHPGGPIEVLDLSCNVLARLDGEGLLDITDGGPMIMALPGVDNRPPASQRLASTSACGGPEQTP
jgi:hypothetical protein